MRTHRYKAGTLPARAFYLVEDLESLMEGNIMALIEALESTS